MSGAVTAVAVGGAAYAAGATAAVAVGSAVAAGAYTNMQYKQQKAMINAQQQQVAVQREAQQQAVAAAERQESVSQQAMARANQKRPDTTAIVERAQQAGRGGPASTMLTGPKGIGQESMQLGRSTLLGS